MTFIFSLEVIDAVLCHENQGSMHRALFITSFIMEWSGEIFFRMTRTTITLLTSSAGFETKRRPEVWPKHSLGVAGRCYGGRDRSQGEPGIDRKGNFIISRPSPIAFRCP